MTLLTSKDGFLLSYLDRVDEPREGIKRLSFSQILIDNDEEVANRS